MALPELDVAQVQRWCAVRCPSTPATKSASNARSPQDISRSSSGAPPGARTSGQNGRPIARLRYTAAEKTWTLYWRNRNLRFHTYEPLAPSHRVEDLLTEIDRDPACIFWG
jgi:hypothetical protein